jgi:DNA-binding NarL/FixJ family response regulator
MAVEDGKRALDTTLGLDPDVLVLDVSMPVMNGFQAASRLRDSKSRTEIVILTTYVDEEYVEVAFSSGASAFVTQQHLETDLVTAIRQVFQEHICVSVITWDPFKTLIPCGRCAQPGMLAVWPQQQLLLPLVAALFADSMEPRGFS